MSKKVLILSGSPRKNGNSDILCDEFARGATEVGHGVEKVRVAEKNIHPCIACYHCRDNGGECVFKDDMAEVLQKIIDADVLVLASPVYFYSIDAQLKAVIDRTVAKWLEVKNKEFYYIITMADEEATSAETTLACFRGYADCVDGAVEKGVIIGGGAYEKGEIKGHPAMAQAYQMGKSI
ncbi:MAG: flavodoxin family protein [Candidatus Cryptobacteroides sp.]